MTGKEIYAGAQQLVIRLLLVAAPAAITGYITLVYLNASFTSFNTSVGVQALYFGLGLMLAYSLYYFRARWIITFVFLWIVYWVAGKIIARLPGEFDVFYATAKYQLYSALFLLGWLFGFLLVRLRYSYLILFGVLAAATLVAVSNTVDISLRYLLLHLVPVFVFGLYMLFISPLLYDRVEMDWRKSGRLFLRLALFLVLMVLAFILAEQIFREDLKAVEKELVDRGAKSNGKGGDEKKPSGYDERHGLMDKSGRAGDDGYRLKDTMRMDTKMSQSDQLMFCSKLDNYFPNGAPKPLYFVYHYLTRYDPVRESFTRDVNVPSFDEFDMDPSTIAMYHSKEDTSIIRKAMADKMRFVVEADVYLSSSTWKHALLAPASAFYCQTIPVEKDFQKTYLSAYRVKSYTSDLNNAYFVYNPSASPSLEPIQRQRYLELLSVAGYKNVDPAFYRYYTELPTGGLYDSIARLAATIGAHAQRPVDKVIAVRDYFLQRDKEGKRVFRYTLKPGGVNDPNIPTASMLGNFLFKTKAGYCTYYAGASLFLLRSMGIPARFTTGFATVNRNDKNKGWYWFYASQAHAWTQVYFPGYGWLDFDMTIGNEDQQGAPRPDGTPPLPPPDPWLVLNAKAESAPDLKSKRMDASFAEMIYMGKQYQLKKEFVRSLDVSVARVLYDKKDTTLSCILPGDSVVVVSYKELGRKIPAPRPSVPIEIQVDEFPAPIIADEIHVKPRDTKSAKEVAKKKKSAAENSGMTWQEMLSLSGKVLAGVLVIVILFPLLVLSYLVLRVWLAKDSKARANCVYQSALYQFHMAGVERENETPLDYARTKIDPVFKAGFEDFMKVYLRLKYGQGGLMAGDQEIMDRFARSFASAVRGSKGFFRIVTNYFNLLLAGRYFFRSEKSELENQPSQL